MKTINQTSNRKHSFAKLFVTFGLLSFFNLIGNNLNGNPFFFKKLSQFKEKVAHTLPIPQCSGTVDAVLSSNGAVNPNNAIGAPDDVVATLDDQNDFIILDFTEVLVTGDVFTIRWRKNPSTGGDPTFQIFESETGTSGSFNVTGTSPFTENSTAFSDNNFTASQNTRYIAVQTTNAFDLDIDAAFYSGIATTPEVSSSSASEGTCNGTTPNNDATITISGITNGDRIDISTAGAGSYDGDNYANAETISGNSHTFDNIPHGTNYIIRVFNGGDLCPLDISITSANPPFNCQGFPNNLPWAGTDCNGTNILLQNGIGALTCGVTDNVPQATRWAFALANFDNVIPATGRSDISSSVNDYHHPSWHVDSIGNVFGTAINTTTGDIFITATSNYGAGFTGQSAIIRYGEIGGGNATGNNDAAAGGAIYRIDNVTGQASLFTTLPQQAATFNNEDCEGADSQTRTNSGVGLGNIAYDFLRDQYFVTNIEDGRIYRLDNTGTILDTYDPFGDDDGAAGISDLEELVYGLALEPDGDRLFFGRVDFSAGTNAQPGSPGVYSIDLSTTGGFTGTNTPTGLGYDNYTGSETLHINITAGDIAGTAPNFVADDYVYSISDLAFNSNGDLIAGMRVGCDGLFHTSYNHFATTSVIPYNNGTDLYNGTPTTLDISFTGDAADEDNYGGVATYTDNEGDNIILVTSSDILTEAGPHGIAIFSDPPNAGQITPLGAWSYGVDAASDPKGVGGDIEVFAECIPICDITGITETCANTNNLVYSGPNGADSYLWSITSGNATISGSNSNQTVTINAGSNNFTLSLTISPGVNSPCSIDVTVNPTPICSITSNSPICAGETLTLNETGGNAISWSWTSNGSATINSANMAMATATNVTDGEVFTVEIIDANGCTNSCTTTATVNPLPTISVNNITCTLPFPSVTYQIQLTTTGTSISATAGTVTNNGGGSFTISNIPDEQDITITSEITATGCQQTQFVSAPNCDCPVVNPPTSGGDETICANESIPALTVTVGVGETADWYDAPAAGNLLATGTTSYTPSGAGTFYAEARNTTTTCTSNTRTAVTLTINPTPTCNATNSGPICNGETLQLNEDGGDAISWNWSTDGSATLDDVTAQTPTASNVTNGEIFTVLITDINGCTNSCTTTAIVNPTPNCNATSSSPICEGQNLQINETGGNATSWLWSSDGSATFNDINAQSPTASNVTNGEVFTVMITDVNGCTNSCSITATVNPTPNCSATNNSPICTGATLQLNEIGGDATSWLWSSNSTAIINDVNAQSPTATNVSNGEIFTVIITDVNGCTNTCVTSAIVSPNPICSTLNNSPICAGETLQLEENGGNTVSWFWSTNGSATISDVNAQSPTAINVSNGEIFTVLITSALGCTSTCNSTAIVNPLPTCNATNNSPICIGQPLQLNENGGNATSWLWSSNGFSTISDVNAQSPTATNVNDGEIFTVIITDINGCTSSCSTTAIIPPAIELMTTVTNVDCNGNATGAIDLEVAGGTAGYSYNWSNGETTQDIAGLTAGTYTVTVTDANSCTSTTSATITEPDPIVLNTTVTNIDCNGNSTGAIDLQVSGGTAGYSYNWSNGETTQDIAGLTAGTYTVTVTDANSCTSTTSATITEPDPIVLNTTLTNVDCNGNATGAIDLEVSGGTAGYSYNWSNGQTTQDIAGLTAGTYTVTVTDANSCTSTTSATITEPDPIVLNTTVTNIDCNGNATGAIDLEVSGGTAGYSYNWSNGETTQDISGLTAGTYTVTVTDANSCTSTTSATVTQPDPILLNTTLTNVDCNGNATGAIDLQVAGGTAGYSYNWSNGETTQDIAGLTAGTYTITVTDANSCTSTTSATITEPDPIVLNTTVTNVDCNGNSTGAIDLQVAGGTAGYSYNWSNGETTQDIAGLTAGTYTVTVTDANSCTSTTSATITEPDPIVLNTTVTNVDCNGNSTGAIDLQVAGGTAGYSYNWSNGETTQDIAGLTAGTYTVTVTDANSCTSTTSATITEPIALSCNIIGMNPSTNGGADGQADASIFGGTPAYSYNWSNGQTTQDISGLMAGTYTLTVTDANGCTSTCSVTLTEPDALNCNIVPTHVSCNGGNDGAADLSVSGGTPAYSYNWSNGQTTQDISGLMAGNFSVTITDAAMATTTCSVTINEPTPIVLNTTVTNIDCNGNSTGAIDLEVSGGTAGYSYNWSNGETTQDIAGLTAGTYTVTVTDANSCTSTTSATITEPDPIVLNTTVTNIDCNGNSTGAIDLEVSGGTAGYSYNWSNGETTQDIAGLTAGTYTVTVTDANSCTSTTSATITEPIALSCNIIGMNPSTNGGADGQADASIFGGTPAYSYNWSNGQTTQDISGLMAGTYTLTVTDANGCTSTCSVTLTEPDALNCNIVPTHVSCNGGNNGAADLSVSGGTPAYSYNWSNGQTTQDISGLMAGNFSVTITDAAMATTTCSVTINEPTPIVLNTTVTNVDCNGNATGAIDLQVAGGTAGYSYNWSNGETTQDISGLTAGTYTVTVTDANSCTSTTSATVTQPDPILLNTTLTNVDCNGNATGAIDLQVAGGTPGYSYNWSNGETTQDIAGLTAGTYTVTVTDANSCTSTTSATITEPIALSCNIIGMNPSTNGGADGQADASIFGGTPAYSYNWSNGQTTQDISGLMAGTYTLTVTDANGCTSTCSVTLTEPDALNCNIVPTHLSCNDGNDGAADLSVSGGTPTYSYNWSNSQTTQDISGLMAGNFSVTITDAAMATTTCSVTINEPTPIVLNTTVTNVDCNGNSTGAIDLQVAGGTAGYSYNWSNGETTQDISGLTAGTYTVTVTDANSCTSTTSATITEPDPIVLNITVTNVDCNGNTTGAIDLQVAGGTAGYSYNWSNGETTQDIAGLTAGTYTVTVTDTNSCTSTTSATITEPDPIVLNTTVTNIDCNGNSTGAIDLQVAGGTAGYSYNWSNGETTQDIAGLTAGTYTVTVTDANSCTSTTSATITEPDPIVLNTTVTNVDCNGNSTGAIDLQVAGGTAGYSYNWSNGETTQDIAGLTAGTYTVTVTDTNSCTSTTSATVTEPDPIVLNTTVTNVDCNGNSTGAIDLQVAGGTAGYSYNWSNGETTQDIAGLTAGTYTVTVTDTNSCTSTTSATITEPDPIVLNTTVTNVDCNGNSTGAIDLQVAGGTAGYSYNWSNGETTQDIAGLTAGTYTVTVTDANSCTSTTSATITEPDPIVLNTTVTNVDCNGNSTGAIDLQVAGGTAGYSYNWSNGETTQDIAGLTAGTYTVTVTDANSCTSTTSATITEPIALSCNIIGMNPSTNGGADGQADASIFGGTPAYSYNWSNGQTTQDISGLMAGTYTLTVTDANGCTSTCSVTLTEPDALNCNIVPTHVSCNGGNNGAADLSVSGGTPAYSYNWSNGQTTQDISGLMAGNFSVTITDAAMATTTCSVTINEPTPIVLNTTVTNIDCNGNATGAIDLEVSGGTAGYSYNWSNGETTQDIAGLTAGTYTVTVTDANSCTSTTSATINEPGAINLSTTIMNIDCNGNTNGSIDLEVSGGTAGYSYNWSNGATTQDIIGLTAGTYTVTVTDANSCISMVNAIISQPSDIVLTTSITDVSCNGTSTGAIDLSVSNGTPPYSYDWDHNGMQDPDSDPQDLSSLDAGTYTVTVTDANGCIAITSATVSEPDAIVLTSSVMDVSCNSTSDGAIDLMVMGGSLPYTYDWNNDGAENPDNDSQDLNELMAGTYAVTVTDANGCTNSLSVTVNSTPAPVCTSTNSGAICVGESLMLNEAGGDAVSWSWSSNGTATFDNASIQNPTVSNATNGETFTVIITDINGCTNSCSNIATVNPAPNCFISGNSTVIESTQDVVYTAPASMTLYNWSIMGNATIDGTSNMQNVTVDVGAPGSFTLTLNLTDGNSCTSTCDMEVIITNTTTIDLALSKIVDNSVANIGDTVTFSIIVQNEGSFDASGIQVEDQLPSGYNFVDDNGMGTYASDIWTIGNLMAGESDTLNIRAEVLASGDYVNNAEIIAANETDIDSDPNSDNMTDDYGDGIPDDDEDSATVDPTAIFDLSLDKHLATGQSNTVTLGDDVEYTIVVSNEGNVTANMIQICDVVPEGMKLSVNDMNNWTGSNPDTLYHTLANPIPPGQSDSINIILRVISGQSGSSITNVAEIFSDSDEDGNGVVDNDSDPANGDINEDDIEEEMVMLLDYDPTGFIYCEKTGGIIPGGTITVTGPNGMPNDPAEVDIIEDGSTGYYAWYAVGPPGIYRMTYTHPDGHVLSSAKTPTSVLYDVPPGPPNITLGSDTINATLIDTTFANNPYYLNFDIQDGDAFVFRNNFPVTCAFIGSMVCNDDDLNDMDDGNEPGFADVIVRLYDCADTTIVLDTTLTDANGFYQFGGLPSGDYRVQFVAPTGFRVISPQSDTLSADGFTSCTSLAFGDCDTTKMVCYRTIPYDWGDLPDLSSITDAGDYQTLSVNNGPSHEIIDGLRFGTIVDEETDGQPQAAALGDGTDEDGFTFPNTLNLRRNITIRRPLNIINTTGITAHLEAWIDWNGDGDFDDPNEMIADLSDDGAGNFGVTRLEIFIPSDAVQNQALGVRFRLSHSDNMTPLGQVDSGEVEDYLISIGCTLEQCLPVGVFISRP